MATSRASQPQFTISQFAERAGVTVRTLHHYDRIGLLKPRRSKYASGHHGVNSYRVYGRDELVRLQQIATLKFIGLPLNAIKGILSRKRLDLAATLDLQKAALEERRRQINLALYAVQQAQKEAAEGKPDAEWRSLKAIMEVLQMQDMEWAKKYYSPEAQAKIAERAKQWTPELQEEVNRKWNELFRDIEQNLDADPAGAKAQSFVDRWDELLRGFTGGDPEVQSGLNKLYADKKGWPQHFKKPWSDAVGEFMSKARAARKG